MPDVAAFTKEMRNIRKALKKRGDYNKNNYYVFLVEKSEKGGKNGIMPFNRHFGFMFMENSQQLKANSQKLYHTIAHELAHGAFTLYHTFSTKDKGITQGSTFNLMDYSTKTPNNLLRKYQWYIIHNPRLSLFGGAEEEVSERDDPLSKYLSLILQKAKNLYESSKVDVVIYSKVCDTKIQETTYNEVSEKPALVIEQPFGEKNVKTLIIFYNFDEDNNESYGYNLSSNDTLGLIQNLSEYINQKVTDEKLALKTLSGQKISCYEFINKLKQQDFCTNIDENFINALYDDVEACIKQNSSPTRIVDKRTVSDSKEISEYDYRLNLIKKLGINATVYLSDETTNQADILEIQEELKNGGNDEIKLWYEVNDNGETSLKDFHVGKESVVLSNGINESEIIKELFEFTQNPDFISDIDLNIALLESLADWVDKLKIPEKYWNPNSKTDIGIEYSPALFNVFRAMNKIQGIISLFDEDTKKDMQKEFALICGIYDGAIGTLSALPDGGALILRLAINKDGAWSKLAEQLQKMQADCAKSYSEVYYIGTPGLEGYAGWGFSKCAWDAIYKHFTTGTEYQIYHKSGKAIFEVALLVVGFAEVGIAARIAKTADYLDAFSLAIKVINPIAKGVFRNGKQLLKFFSKEGKQFIKFVDNNGNDVAGSFKWIEVTDKTGKNQYLGLDAEQADLQKMKTSLDGKLELVKNKEGNIIESGEEYRFAEWNDGSADGQLAVVANPKKLADEILEKLSKSDKFSEKQDLFKTFKSDFEGNVGKLVKFDVEPGLVDSWKVMSSNKTFRKDDSYLEKMRDYLAEPYNTPAGNFYPEDDKLKKAFDAANKKGKAKGFVDSKEPKLINDKIVINTEGAFGTTSRTYFSIKPNFKKLEEIKKYLSNQDLINFTVDGKIYELKGLKNLDLEFGYAGVMTPDGRMTFTLSTRLNDLFEKADFSLITGGKSISQNNGQRIIEEGLVNHLKELKTNNGIDLLGEELKHIESIAPRNGSHEYGWKILKENGESDFYWGFSINPKNGKVEIGFGSGQVNKNFNNGLSNANDYIDKERALGVLNRTYQKKVQEYLNSFFKDDNLEFILKTDLKGGEGYYW